MIRVLICDDQWIVCEGLEAILDADLEIEVAGIAHDGAEALDKVAATHPDVVLMDLKMPIMNGVQATRKIVEQYPQVKVLVLTTYGDDEWLFDAVRSGAVGYLLKGAPRANLIAAVKGAAAGESHIDPAVAGKLLGHIARQGAPAVDSTLLDALSDRELEILRLVARGLSNAEIATHLFLSPGTVRNYVSAILTKLNVTDRTQAAVLALRHGLE
ncbi:MAG TPA: response regulator transcription factor [Anaerolineae bacterium]|nr:response regulator transcription factor [Anaerolineae bacterium]HQI86145.1 response regulator transcription factor [Anaerolineae bacterium]